MPWIFLLLGFTSAFLFLLLLTFKWQLDKKISLTGIFFTGLLSSIIIIQLSRFFTLGSFTVLVLEFILMTLFSTLLILWRFYRDPERKSLENENAILSPADGKIIYIREIENGEVPFSEKSGRKLVLSEFLRSNLFSGGGYIIGISMTFLDVHVNRAPIAGKIALLKHIKGLFLSLKRDDAVLQNERVLMVLDNGFCKVGVVQIASRLVRRIVPYVKETNEVLRGERIGMIKFGSQVDIILPKIDSLKIDVKPLDYVKAGITKIGSI